MTLGLIHGAQPDALVLCHHPRRSQMRHCPGYELPALEAALEAALAAARLTNPAVVPVGVSLNSSEMETAAADELLERVEHQLALPTVDPVRTGVGPIVDHLLATVAG